MIRSTTVWFLAALCTGLGVANAQRLNPRATGGLLQGMAPDATDLDLRTTPVVRAVQRAADSVVSIYILGGRRRNSEAIDGQGSGVIVDEDGLVITNWHVIFPLKASPERFRAEVKLKSGDSYPAELMSSSPEHDLALLQLRLPEGEKVKPVVASDSDSLMVGETVIAIGNPQGKANTVTVGVLSATDRFITVNAPDRRTRRYRGLLQTDAAINSGNSGGALLDITGKLIGINNAMAVGVENIGFAIPVNTVRRVFEDVLLSSDSLASVWLGARVRDNDGGAFVTELAPNSPADRSGMRRGDRIVEVAGTRIGSALEFTRSAMRARAGEPLSIVVDRRGRELRLRPVPMSNIEWELVRRMGLEFEPVTPDDDPRTVRAASEFFFEEVRRSPRTLPVVLRVARVHPNSPGEDTGFEPGDVLYGIKQRSPWSGETLRYFRDLGDFADIARMRSGQSLEVLVLRDERGKLINMKGELDVRRL